MFAFTLICVPAGGTVPFSTQMTVTLNNQYWGQNIPALASVIVFRL